ncbi:MAG: winged helix-turn-helix domain-containing protein [Pyrinomonadaceae bacterium]|nr:winged helix-turn-helix domain-containing protein [Pyrinomonadaceae bacterium]
MSDSNIFVFDQYMLAPDERLLLRDGQPVAVTPKTFDLLVVLVRNSGHLVGKDELLQQVWPDSFVEEVSLSVNISALRKALGGDQTAARFIETVPKRGYRFIAPVKRVGNDTAEIVFKRRLKIVAEIDESVAHQDAATSSEVTLEGPSRLASRRRIVLTVAAFLVIVVGAFLFWRMNAKHPAVQFDSLAVLPFTTADASDEYLADGLSEATINGLAQLPKLRVAPRTSTFRYKRQPLEPQRMGGELGVQGLVLGKVVSHGETLDIQVDLINVANNSRVWGSQYHGKVSDLVSLQTRISRDLVRAIGLPLNSDEEQRLFVHVTENSDAYRAYLQGRYFWNHRTEEGLQKSIVAFHRATEIDPNFALAFSGLADSYTTLGYLSYISPTQAFPPAKNYALKALELDPSLAEAHASLAYDKFYFDWDWAGAEVEFRRAIELNDRYATAHQWYSIYLQASGRPDEAFREIQLARERDPLSLSINTDIGFHLYYNRQYDEAIKQLQSVLEMKKDFPLAHLWLGRSYQQIGKYNDALGEFQQVEDAFHGWAVSLAAVGFINGVTGRKAEALKVLEALDELSKKRFVTSYGVALVYAGLGQKDQTFVWLNKAFDERSHWLVWLKRDPRWDGLRSDARFAQLVARMDFPQ